MRSKSFEDNGSDFFRFSFGNDEIRFVAKVLSEKQDLKLSTEHNTPINKILILKNEIKLNKLLNDIDFSDFLSFINFIILNFKSY